MTAVNIPLKFEEGAVFHDQMILMTRDLRRRTLATHMPVLYVRQSPTAEPLLAEIGEYNGYINVSQDRADGEIEILIPSDITQAYSWTSAWYNLELWKFSAAATLSNPDTTNYHYITVAVAGKTLTVTNVAGAADPKPFAALVNGDFIYLSASGTAYNNNGVGRVDTVTDGSGGGIGDIVTFQNTIRGISNVDNFDIQAQVLTFVGGEHIRILEGSCRLSREVVRTTPAESP